MHLALTGAALSVGLPAPQPMPAPDEGYLARLGWTRQAQEAAALVPHAPDCPR